MNAVAVYIYMQTIPHLFRDIYGYLLTPDFYLMLKQELNTVWLSEHCICLEDILVYLQNTCCSKNPLNIKVW